MSEPLANQVLGGRYRLIVPIAKGGMGAVYEAEDVKSGQRVALKLIRDEFLQDVVSIERFRREAMVSASVRHPSLVATLDVSLDSAPAYFVMELIDGPTIAELLSHADRLPSRRAAQIALDVLEGLVALHAAGAIHRDIKPSNIMLVHAHGRERAKLIDLGVIRVAPGTGEESLTWTGNVVGTPSYMAPEQFMGAAVDARADLYSLGVVLAKMLLGAHAVLALPLLPTQALATMPADVVPELARFTADLLRGDRDERPATAALARDRLAAILASVGEDAPPTLDRVAYGDASYAPPRTRGDDDSIASQPEGTPPSRSEPFAAPSLSVAPVVAPRARAAPKRVLAAIVALVAIASSLGAAAMFAFIASGEEEPAVPASARNAAALVSAPNFAIATSATQQRIVPMGVRLRLFYGVPDAENYRAAMLEQLEAPLRRCVDPATHPLGTQVVNIHVRIDAAGRLQGMDTTRNQTRADEEPCVERAFRAAQWRASPSGAEFPVIALADL